MAVNEEIVTGRKFRKLVDEINKKWQRYSIWSKAIDTEFDDGKNAETKLGAIDGITDSLSATSSNIALSALAGKHIMDKLNTGIVLSYENGNYYAQHGEDANTKKLLGEIEKAKIIEALSSSGLGLTQQSTPEQIYTALASAFPGNINSPLTVSGSQATSPNITYNWYGSAYNLTGYKKLSVTVTANWADYYDWNYTEKYFYDRFRSIFGVGQSKTAFSKMVASSDYGNGYQMTGTYTQQLELDVSDLIGNYYIGVGTKGWNGAQGENCKVNAYSSGYSTTISGVVFS